MTRLALVAVLLLLARPGLAQSPPTYTVFLDGHNFTLPVGFTIERIAGPPFVDRPVAVDFDERGRLYATEVDGAIEKPDIQAQKKAHRVVRLEDANRDGFFEKSNVFADQLAFPEGVMCLAGSVYVAAPPQIWKLTDTDDDGVADRREVWFDGQTIGGCANDLHGPYRGPDGWVYWCKGGFGKQTYTLPGGKTFNTRAAHIFRARPDGTGIEPVMTGGMDNPVDVVFTPGGERIFSTTFLQRPAAGLRDGLIHAIYGGVYGKDQEVVYEADHKWTSPELMPVLVHQGPSAPCGLHRLESDQFGAEYQDNVFCCNFNLRKISRHVLKPHGSTFVTEDHDFLVSDNTDFHPTDVIEDADGSLLVVDTGGWYKLCCPSSQLVKADVLGAIYRVRKLGSHNVKNPRIEPYFRGNLYGLLNDPRPALRRLVVEDLAMGASSDIKIIHAAADTNSPALMAISAVSAACRIGGESSLTAIRRVLAHPDATARQAAIQAVGLHRDKKAVQPLIALLESSSLHNRRAAAEALGRIGDVGAVHALLVALMDEKNDRALDHSLTYALIEIGDEASVRRVLAVEDLRVRRAALVALDQMGAKLDPQTVLDILDHPHQPLRDSARWIASRHTEWDEPLSQYLRRRLAAPMASETEQAQVVELLTKLAKSGAIQRLFVDTCRQAATSPAAARMVLKAMAASGNRELPAAWSEALVDLLEADSPVLADALATVRAIPPARAQSDEVAKALAAVGDSAAPAALRLAAMAAAPGGLKAVSASQFALLMEHLDRDQPAELRSVAADVVSRAKFSADQLQELARRLPRFSPLDLDRVLGAYAQSADDAAGLALITALNAPELRATVTVDGIRQRLAKYSPVVKAQAEKLYSELDAEFAQQSANLEGLLASLPAGDIRRGQAVFNSSRTSCRACHTIGYVGGKIGPDLTRIGQIRQGRDLLESIVYPSLSFVRSYETLAVRTLDGQVHSGVVKTDSPVEIVLTIAADKEVRIPREEIEIMQPGKVSIMPAGMDKQLSPQELADLVEFLRNCK
jgi:putative membrane-bound dehydrogenase-like protein